MPPDYPLENANQLLAVLMSILDRDLSRSTRQGISYVCYQEYFDPLKYHGIPPSHPLYDIAFYLLCSSLVQNHGTSLEHLIPILEVWGLLRRPNIRVFHYSYIVPEFWEQYFQNSTVREHFAKYFETWVERADSLTWDEFSKDLNTYFTHQFPRLTKTQFKTLLAIIKNQTDNIKELTEVLHRSKEALSRDKKRLYSLKALYRSIWLDFPKLGLKQRILILFHQPKKTYKAFVNPHSPWLCSLTHTYLLNRYSIITFLAPQTQRVDVALVDLKEQFINTSDVNEALLIEPTYPSKRPVVTIDYTSYDPKTQKWDFDVGFPYSITRLKEPSSGVIYLRPRRSLSSSKASCETHDTSTLRYSVPLMQTIDLVFRNGWQSIRQIQDALSVSFHTARKLVKTITSHGLCYERFVSTMGSYLSTLFVLLACDNEKHLSKMVNFFTYFPEQYTSWTHGDIQGLLSYIRVPPEYQQETMDAIETVAHPCDVMIMPLIGARDLHWRFPWDRWDEKQQKWIIKPEDFMLLDL